MNISIGTKIRYLRKLSNLTQEELAERLGTTKSAVGMWETDKRNPNTHMIHKIAEIFSKDVSYFIKLEYEDDVYTAIDSNTDNLVMKTVDEFVKLSDDSIDLNDFISSIEISDNVNKKLTIDSKTLSDAELDVLVKQLEGAVEIIRIMRGR